MVRNLIHASTEILRDAYDQAQPADELLDRPSARSSRSPRWASPARRSRWHEVLDEAYDRIDKRAPARYESISGLPTGFARPRRDDGRACTNSELIILAARPSVGKTAFALNVVRQHRR